MVPYTGPAAPRAKLAPADRPARPPPDPRKLGPGSPSSSKSKVKTITALNDTEVCKRFNDQRGCKAKCPHGKLH
eukprot:2272464-Karenia_brevis.AAC.1